MVQQAGDEAVTVGAQQQWVSPISKHGPALRIRDAEVEMQAAAGCMSQWFGHAAEHHAVALRHRMRRHLEQDEAVGSGQRLVKAVIDLVLAAGVLVVDLLQLKAERSERLAHVL